MKPNTQDVGVNDGPPMQALEDEEGARVPDGVRVWDAHVHLFPERVFAALWRWFETHAWPVRYQLTNEALLDFLLERGVERVVGLTFAHKDGMAESLNVMMAEVAARRPEVIPLGTVMPGEPDARGIVRRAFAAGLRGLKLHCHVQGMRADDARLDPVYEEAAAAERPIVIHAGPAPVCGGYPVDPREVCTVEAIANALSKHPDLTLIVPHLGADLYDGVEALLDRFPRLYLDTTMCLAEFFAERPPTGLLARRADRLLFGTDFPNLPFAWDRELKAVLATDLSAAQRDAILWQNAERLFLAP